MVSPGLQRPGFPAEVRRLGLKVSNAVWAARGRTLNQNFPARRNGSGMRIDRFSRRIEIAQIAIRWQRCGGAESDIRLRAEFFTPTL